MTSSSSSPTSRRSEFGSFLNDDWLLWTSENPEIGTSIGLSGFNDRWTDDSESGIARRRTHLQESRTRLLQFEREALSAAEHLDYDLYRGLLERAAVGARLGYDPLPYDFGQPHDLRTPMNQLEGIHVTSTDMLEMAPRERLSDYEDRLARLRALPRTIRQQRALLDAGRNAGITPPRVAVAGLPDQIRNLLRADPSESALLSSFLDLPPRFGPTDRARLLQEARAAYTDGIAPALEELLDYLVTQYLPACRETIGISALPGGAEAYQHLVHRMTTTDLTPQQIHEIGLKEVRRLRTEMDGIMTRTRILLEASPSSRSSFGPTPSFTGVVAKICSKRLPCDREEDRPAARTTVRSSAPTALTVRRGAGFREKASPAADLFRRAPATGPRLLLRQHLRGRGSPPLGDRGPLPPRGGPGPPSADRDRAGTRPPTEFRRWSGPTASIEGWGWTQRPLGKNSDSTRTRTRRSVELMADASRSIRLVVDSGYARDGFDEGPSDPVFRENTALSDVGIQVEVDRYIVWPGRRSPTRSVSSIREMRTLSETRLGDRFDIRAVLVLVGRRVAARPPGGPGPRMDSPQRSAT